MSVVFRLANCEQKCELDMLNVFLSVQVNSVTTQGKGSLCILEPMSTTS